MIRLSKPLSLIFFVLVFNAACKQKEHQSIAIVWSNGQATGIAVPKKLLQHYKPDSTLRLLQIRLKDNIAGMLGDYSIHGDQVLFIPLIPLTRGMEYEVVFRNTLIGSINIPFDSAGQASSLMAVYPASDTLATNLLKFYFQFSAPMREGEALQHITLLNENNDTVPGVFLDLQLELWNEERTVLTVWLDPGRIKRGLIPNKQMGNPLENGKRYTLSVSSLWKDAQGFPLRQSYNRTFVAGPRDSIRPQPSQWTMKLPKPGTNQPLEVVLDEPLDYFLLQETIRFVDENGKAVEGSVRIGNKETGFAFFPAKQWQRGHYRMLVSAYLEDLAGNNLERLFDRDILMPQAKLQTHIIQREFIIEN